jgi:hypothetical protein
VVAGGDGGLTGAATGGTGGGTGAGAGDALLGAGGAGLGAAGSAAFDVAIWVTGAAFPVDETATVAIVSSSDSPHDIVPVLRDLIVTAAAQAR